MLNGEHSYIRNIHAVARPICFRPDPPACLFAPQADINSQNLARLNRYCHRVCPATRPSANAAASAFPDLSGGGMPPLPAPAGGGGGAGGVDDLLGLGDLEISAGAPRGGGEGGGGRGEAGSGKLYTVTLGSRPPLQQRVRRERDGGGQRARE